MKIFKNIIFLIAVYVLSSMSSTNAQEKSRILIFGRAKIEMMPDIAVITAQTTTRAKSAAEAIDANTSIINKLISFSKNFGKVPPVVETKMVSVRDDVRQVTDPNTKIQRYETIGFIASNTITIKTNEITTTGKLSREILNLGPISIQGISFAIANQSLANQTAQQAAFENAKENAEKLAAATGRKLGTLVRLVSPPREEAVRGEDGAADMPLRRGTFSAQIPIEIGLVSASAVVDTEWILE